MRRCHSVTVIKNVTCRYRLIVRSVLQACVMDAMELIEAKRAETLKRVSRLRTQLESAECELRNLDITAETLTRLNLNPAVDTTVPRGQSFNQVYGVLGNTPDDAKSPKEIYDALVASGVTSITQDNVRTIVSRYRDRLESGDGKYWQKADKENEPTSDVAVGPDAGEESAPTLTYPWSNPEPSQ